MNEKGSLTVLGNFTPVCKIILHKENYEKKQLFKKLKNMGSVLIRQAEAMNSEKAMEDYKPKRRINVMVSVDLLDKIDTIKKQKGMDRSKLICDAVEEHLTHAAG